MIKLGTYTMNAELHRLSSAGNSNPRTFPKGPSTQLSYTLKNSNLHNYYPKPEYLIIGTFGPLGLYKPQPATKPQPET